MLTETFLHLPGIGRAMQKKMNDAGIVNWDDAYKACNTASFSGVNHGLLALGLEEAQKRLEDGDALWFSQRLCGAEAWRLYPHFAHSAAYVDIETTGLGKGRDHITSIALYDGGSVRCYVYGRNLEDFAKDIEAYALLVTWNGAAFDAPFLRRALNIELNMAHLDLLPVFRALNLRGGLKAVEKTLGLNRSGLEGADGVDGMTAVLLWQEFKRSNNERALETLLAYNVEDVLSLEYLSRYACKAHGCALPGLEPDLEAHNTMQRNPYRADKEILDKVQKRRWR